jgi:choline dehydrogenase-like flavoprotein
VAGLHVADASLFPTSVGVNPMMTIIAFSKRIAAGLLDADPRADAVAGPQSRRRIRGSSPGLGADARSAT